MDLNMLHSSGGCPKFTSPVSFWHFSSLKSERLAYVSHQPPSDRPERRRSTGSPFAASSLEAEKSPPALHEHSFALKFTMLVTFETERVLKTPALRLPQPRGAVQLPAPARSRAWLAVPWLGRGRLPWEPPEPASGIPILAGGSLPVGSAVLGAGNGSTASERGAAGRATAITSCRYRCCAERHLGTNPAVKSRRFAQHRQLRLLPSYPAVVSRPDRQEQRP